MSKSKELAKPTLPTHPGTEAKPDELRAYNAAIVQLAQQGNEDVIPIIRKWMSDARNVDRLGGDLAFQVHASLAQKVAGKDIMFREAVLKKSENLRNEIGGLNPSPVERLLVERIVACWTYLNYIELVYTQNDTDLTINQCLFRQKVLDRAHGRYLSAIKALADVRRLALPVLQMNIAKKQVNMSGTSIAPNQ